MKLAQVNHIRCHQRDLNEPETYVWIPDEMDSFEFRALVLRARDAYDKAGVDFEAAEKKPSVTSWGGPDFKKYPDKTVAEVVEIHRREHDAYKRWDDLKREAQKDFAYHLCDVSAGQITHFHQHTLEVSAVLDWGHRHGQKIAFSETKAISKDVKGTVPREEW